VQVGRAALSRDFKLPEDGYVRNGAALPQGAGGHRVEADGRALSLRAVEDVGQVEEPGERGDAPEARGGVVLSRISQLDQRTALPDQRLPSAEADVRPPRRKSGFDRTLRDFAQAHCAVRSHRHPSFNYPVVFGEGGLLLAGLGARAVAIALVREARKNAYA
jgi:hypothetical protein